MKCPVCAWEHPALLCPRCGFDSSRDYTKYPTFGTVGKLSTASAQRKEWEEKQKSEAFTPPQESFEMIFEELESVVEPDAEVNPRKKKSLVLIATCAAVAFLINNICADNSKTTYILSYRAKRLNEYTILGTDSSKQEEQQSFSYDIPYDIPYDYITYIAQNRYDSVRLHEFPEFDIEITTTVLDNYPIRTWAILEYDLYHRWSEKLLIPSTWKNNILKKDNTALHKVYGSDILRKDVDSAVFLDSLVDAPDNAMDVSVQCDGSVKLWAVQKGKLYTLYFAADGGINAKHACQGLFSGYRNLKEIDFGRNFHTEHTESMSHMFNDCSALKKIDLSSFDTTNVTDTDGMFRNCPAGADWQHLLH